MKILDLFNEYNLSPEMTWWEMEQPRTEKDWNTMSRMDKAYIVSKDFWWIKRLVDNDKIDQDTKFLISANVENQKNGMWYVYTYEQYESLLMLLAISDEPLTFLISVLK